MRRLAFVPLVLMMALPLAALGGGMTVMRSPDEFVEPGETVEMVAYENVPEAQLTEGPWVAHLALEPMADSVEPQWLRLGEVEITPVKWSGYGTHRVYVTFEVPGDLAVGIYGVGIFNDAGDDLEWVYGWVKVGLPVGLEEANYEWPLDEPLVAKLPFWATLTPISPGVLVKDLREGRYPMSAGQYLLDPSILNDPGITLVAPTTTTVPEPPTTAAPAATAPPTTQWAPASPSTRSVIPGAVPTGDNRVLPTLVMVSLMLTGVAALLGLAARRRGVHVVLGVRPVTTPLPPDSSEGVDDYVPADNQTPN
jgi:hypothetical protein